MPSCPFYCLSISSVATRSTTTQLTLPHLPSSIHICRRLHGINNHAPNAPARRRKSTPWWWSPPPPPMSIDKTTRASVGDTHAVAVCSNAIMDPYRCTSRCPSFGIRQSSVATSLAKTRTTPTSTTTHKNIIQKSTTTTTTPTTHQQDVALSARNTVTQSSLASRRSVSFFCLHTRHGRQSAPGRMARLPSSRLALAVPYCRCGSTVPNVTHRLFQSLAPSGHGH